MRNLRAALAVAALAAPAARCEVITGYSEARHALFVGGGVSTAPTVNPTFYLGGFDFSGVGWVGGGATAAHFAMITPRHFIAAQHFSGAYAPGQTVNFRPRGTTSGPAETNVIASLTPIAGSDVLLGTLTTEVSAAVAKYPIVTGTRPQFVNAELYTLGQQSRVGRNRVSLFQDAVDIGFGTLTNTVIYDYDTAGPQYQLDSTGGFNPDEVIVQGGDSGSPSFIPINGTLGLLGHHIALVIDDMGTPSTADDVPYASVDSFLNDYRTPLAATVFANGGYTLATVPVPEPSSLVLMAAASAAAWWRRSSRRKGA